MNVRDFIRKEPPGPVGYCVDPKPEHKPPVRYWQALEGPEDPDDRMGLDITEDETGVCSEDPAPNAPEL